MAHSQYTIQQSFISEYEIKKSRFIGIISPCESERDAALQLNEIAQQNPQANHLAFAWKFRNADGSMNIRFHDAGEPSGTAGKPILSYLEGADLINCLIAVVRYFGGVKLGAGGLTRAYGQAAKQALEVAELLPWVLQRQLQFVLDYPDMQQFEYELKKHQGMILEQQFQEQIRVIVQLPDNKANVFKELYATQYQS